MSNVEEPKYVRLPKEEKEIAKQIATLGALSVTQLLKGGKLKYSTSKAEIREQLISLETAKLITHRTNGSWALTAEGKVEIIVKMKSYNEQAALLKKAKRDQVAKGETDNSASNLAPEGEKMQPNQNYDISEEDRLADEQALIKANQIQAPEEKRTPEFTMQEIENKGTNGGPSISAVRKVRRETTTSGAQVSYKRSSRSSRKPQATTSDGRSAPNISEKSMDQINQHLVEIQSADLPVIMDLERKMAVLDILSAAAPTSVAELLMNIKEDIEFLGTNDEIGNEKKSG